MVERTDWFVGRTTWSVVERSVADIDNLSDEERLQALEQFVVNMQSEVLQARTAAVQAEQRATNAETRVLGAKYEGFKDTRLLGKSKSFDGAMDN